MILISVFNLKEDSIAKVAARLSGCKLYKVEENIKQFESPLSNVSSARRLISFFRQQGYQVTSQRLH